MRIGILGTGNMGRVLGLTLAEAGHEVYFGARDLAQARQAVQLAGALARGAGPVAACTLAEAATQGEVVYYSPRDVPPAEVLADPAVLDGKVVITSGNGPVPADFAFDTVTSSRAEALQAALPPARVVAAFHTVTQELFEHAHADLARYGVACFLAGDDEDARATVGALAAQLGFVPVDRGRLRQARLIESAADLLRLILYARRSPWATFSLTELPPVATPRLGGRTSSALTRHRGAANAPSAESA